MTCQLSGNVTVKMFLNYYKQNLKRKEKKVQSLSVSFGHKRIIFTCMWARLQNVASVFVPGLFALCGWIKGKDIYTYWCIFIGLLGTDSCIVELDSFNLDLQPWFIVSVSTLLFKHTTETVVVLLNMVPKIRCCRRTRGQQ